MLVVFHIKYSCHSCQPLPIRLGGQYDRGSGKYIYGGI